MRALDPRLVRRARPVRSMLAADAALGVVAALFVLAQAVLLARVAAEAFEGASLGDVAVPLATYTGWNVRHDDMGQGGFMTSGAPLFGTTLVFPRTRAEREASGDPRRSIEERYTDRQDYLQRVRRASTDLVRERFMLEGDVDAAVMRAHQAWRAVVEK